MKKLWLFALLFLQAGRFVMAQTTIVQWDFNGNTTPTGQVSATVNLIGGTSSTFAAGVGTSIDPGSPNQAINTASYPAQGQNPQTAGIQINASTIGYSSIFVKFYIRHSGTAAKKVNVQYLNGTTWQDISTYNAPLGGNTTNLNEFSDIQVADLTTIASANNSANFKVRFVTDFSNSTSYVSANGTASSYAGGSNGGTIRYDLITITGTPTGCGTLATQQVSGFRLLKTDNSSAQLTLNRGNGGGCLVLCSSAGIPNTTPVNGTYYTANSTMGNSGTAVGNAFAVYNTQVNNPFIHYFNINGLTTGTKYYIAAYEYSTSGYCYLTPGTVDSFYCNSTILYPGDVQFVGYDNNDNNGRDAFVLTNLKPLKKGTSFQIVNSRFEAGAAANVRTNKWYAGSDNINDDIQSILITYDASIDLSAGSILSFKEAGATISSIQLNGFNSNSFSITTRNVIGTASILSGTDPEQFFLTQGKFTVVSSGSNNQYSLLDGHVLHGISYSNPWVDFNQACSPGNQSGDRMSRVPSDIRCLKLAFSSNPPTSNGFAFYSAAQYSGSQAYLLGQLNNALNWTSNTGTGNPDISSNVFTTPFTVTASPATANWTGGTDSNWFNCSNWENLYVPDSTADVSIPSAIKAPAINNSNSLALEYSSLAAALNLSIPTGTVSLAGSAADKLVIYDSLNIGSNGTLTTSGAATDTVVIRGSIQSQNASGLQLSNNGWLSLQGNRQLQPINVSLPGTTPIGVAALSLNNPQGINISNGGFETVQKLELTNGILSPGSNGFHYIGANCTISSPNNLYNEPNIGWEKSYIDSKIFIRTNTKDAPYTAPLGSKQKGVFAPMVVRPASSGATIYEAGYTGTSHPRTDPADINNPPITKVSTQEYWTLISNPINAAANLTLYYTPLSFVGGAQGTDPQALTDLKIVQYWDSSANSPYKWRYPTFPVSYTAGPTVQYGKISMGANQYVTSLNSNDKNFTLGSGMGINTLPVRIINWAAQLQGNRTRLSWQVQQETGMAHYTVEKSGDGKNFLPLQTVYAANVPAYACLDYAPASGWNYYRLKMTETSGKAGYTTVEKIWLKHTLTFATFPNPATENVYVSLPSTAKATLSLYAPDGKKCIEQTTTTTSFTQLNVKGLAAGWYLLEYWDGKNRMTQKLMIK